VQGIQEEPLRVVCGLSGHPRWIGGTASDTVRRTAEGRSHTGVGVPATRRGAATVVVRLPGMIRRPAPAGDDWTVGPYSLEPLP
jgi:hypothetical protein